MTEPTIFDAPVQGDVPPVTQPSSTPSVSVPPELQELVGEGKKYKTVEAAIASLPHHTAHIGKLETELAQLREEVAKRKTTQELLDEIKSGIPTGASTPKQEFNQDAVAALVRKVVDETKAGETQASNVATIVDTFKATYGDQAEAQYNKVAAEAGLTVAALNQLAKVSPQAVIKLAGIGKTVTPPVGKIKSDVNTTPTNHTPSGQPTSFVGKSNNSKDLLAAWRTAGEIVKQRLG